MPSYPIFYGPYGPSGLDPNRLDPWANLAADRRRQSAGSVPTVRKKAPTSTSSRPPGMTVEQWVKMMTDKYMKAKIDSINAQKSAYLDELNKAARLEEEKGYALGEALKSMNIPGQISSIYGNASADIGGLAQAFSGTLRNTATADAAAQTRMLSGTGQEGAVRNQGEAMGNVTYGVGGYIPARSMSESGAAFSAQAALEPGFAARIGNLNSADVLREGQAGLKEFEQALMDAEGERFQIESELRSGKQKEFTDAQDTAYERLQDEREWHLKQAALALQVGDRKRYNQQNALAQRKQKAYEAAKQGRAVDGSLLPGFELDANGNVVEAITPYQKASLAKSKAKTTKTATSARTKARKEREDDFSSATADLPDDVKDLGTTVKGKYGLADSVKYPSYQVAFSKLWTKYKYLLRYAGSGGQKQIRARITKLIDEALAAEGITKPQPVRKPSPGLSGDSPRTR